MSEPERPSQTPSFESALAELESIVARMEGSQMTLEESLQGYRRGAELIKLCQAQLADAQQQVRVLENDQLKPFAANSGLGGSAPAQASSDSGF